MRTFLTAAITLICCLSSYAQMFTVIDSSKGTAIWAQVSSDISPTLVGATAIMGLNFATGPLAVGVVGLTTGPEGRGVFGSAEGSNGIGVRGKAPFGEGVYGEGHRGIRGITDTNLGIGVYGSASGDTGQTGVFGLAEAADGKGVVGKGPLCDFDAIGTGTDYCSTSSKRWKIDIKNLTEPLDKLSKLRGVTFMWDYEHGGHGDIGFIAEEVGMVLPQIVVYEANGVDASSMDYSKMTPLLVEAANAMRKEYQEKFEKQQFEIDQLKEDLALLKKLVEIQGEDKSSTE